MKLEDIKVGMKVKLLGKHGCGDEYDNIEDWFEKYNVWEEVMEIQKQGYGVVRRIDNNTKIKISYNEDADFDTYWSFAHFDLEPYEEITQIKTPKEWLLTPLAIFTVRDGDECITLGNNTSCVINDGTKWSDDLNEEYNEDLIYIDEYDGDDIMQITYNGEIVWKRKEYMTLTDAIKTGKNIKHKTWDEKDFMDIENILVNISDEDNDNLISYLTDKVWEVE